MSGGRAFSWAIFDAVQGWSGLASSAAGGWDLGVGLELELLGLDGVWLLSIVVVVLLTSRKLRRRGFAVARDDGGSGMCIGEALRAFSADWAVSKTARRALFVARAVFVTSYWSIINIRG